MIPPDSLAVAWTNTLVGTVKIAPGSDYQSKPAAGNHLEDAQIQRVSSHPNRQRPRRGSGTCRRWKESIQHRNPSPNPEGKPCQSKWCWHKTPPGQGAVIIPGFHLEFDGEPAGTRAGIPIPSFPEHRPPARHHAVAAELGIVRGEIEFIGSGLGTERVGDRLGGIFKLHISRAVEQSPLRLEISTSRAVVVGDGSGQFQCPAVLSLRGVGGGDNGRRVIRTGNPGVGHGPVEIGQRRRDHVHSGVGAGIGECRWPRREVVTLPVAMLAPDTENSPPDRVSAGRFRW